MQLQSYNEIWTLFWSHDSFPSSRYMCARILAMQTLGYHRRHFSELNPQTDHSKANKVLQRPRGHLLVTGETDKRFCELEWMCTQINQLLPKEYWIVKPCLLDTNIAWPWHPNFLRSISTHPMEKSWKPSHYVLLSIELSSTPLLPSPYRIRTVTSNHLIIRDYSMANR